MAEAESNANGPAFQRSARIRAFAKAMGDDMSTSAAGYAPLSLANVKGASEEELEVSGFDDDGSF